MDPLLVYLEDYDQNPTWNFPCDIWRPHLRALPPEVETHLHRIKIEAARQYTQSQDPQQIPSKDRSVERYKKEYLTASRFREIAHQVINANCFSKPKHIF